MYGTVKYLLEAEEWKVRRVSAAFWNPRPPLSFSEWAVVVSYRERILTLCKHQHDTNNFSVMALTPKPICMMQPKIQKPFRVTWLCSSLHAKHTQCIYTHGLTVHNTNKLSLIRTPDPAPAPTPKASIIRYNAAQTSLGPPLTQTLKHAQYNTNDYRVPVANANPDERHTQK